jgi:hypothetical protein
VTSTLVIGLSSRLVRVVCRRAASRADPAAAPAALGIHRCARRGRDDGRVSPPRDTFEGCVRVDRPDGRSAGTKRRVLYGTTTSVLVLIVGLALVDATGTVDVYGVDTAHARATGGGHELDVRYGTVSRPGIATPFEITVRRAGGFSGPVTLAVAADYLSVWDENGLDPQPASETATADTLVWEFDPPAEGDTLVVSYDARIEPAAQRGKRGRVAVLDDANDEIVSVTFRTNVRP